MNEQWLYYGSVAYICIGVLFCARMYHVFYFKEHFKNKSLEAKTDELRKLAADEPIKNLFITAFLLMCFLTVLVWPYFATLKLIRTIKKAFSSDA